MAIYDGAGGASFGAAAARQQPSEAEQALKEWGIEYRKEEDGTIIVLCDIDISEKGLNKLPDLSKVEVKGSFICSRNQLTSLQGSPFAVGGSFLCGDNLLVSLQGCPKIVRVGFSCSGNQLVSLQGAPENIGGTFWCESNILSSLEYAPKKFTRLASDFGTFDLWEAVPEHLHISPETIRKIEQQKLEGIRAAANMPLKRPLKSLRSISFES